jgi:phospholipase C
MKRTTARLNTAVKCLLAATLVALVLTPIGIRAQNEDRQDENDRQERTPIRHLVVIFQENVSFDHYFATYPHAANTDGSSFTAKAGTPHVNGLFPGGLLTKNPNSVQPFRLSSTEAATCDQDHGYADEQRAFNAGGMDKFPETVGVGGPSCLDYGKGKGLVMGYYDGNTVTALWNYAQHFAMSDNSYSATFGPSTPGALNLIAGQTHGAMMAPDLFGHFGSASGNVTAIDGSGIGSVIGDPRPSPALDNCTIPSNADPTKARAYVTMTGPNVGDLLNQHRITWGWFQGGFKPAAAPNPPLNNTPGATGPIICGSTHSGVPGTGTSYDYIPHHEPFQYYPQTANPSHKPPSSTAMIGRTDQANHQYDLEAFFAALDAGHLPAVSYVKAAAYQDGHAGYSSPLDEQTFLIGTINKLMQSPEWEHMAIIVLYDDSDGWYDHQMGPIVNQSKALNPVSGLPDDDLFGSGAMANCGTLVAGTFNGRCGYGPRQPFLVISPWARQNVVDHNVTDQSSVLRFIEDNWGLGRLGNQSTDAIAGPLEGMFDFIEEHPRAPQLILNTVTGNPLTRRRTPLRASVITPGGPCPPGRSLPGAPGPGRGARAGHTDSE